MPSSAVAPGTPISAQSLALDQLYVTHCLFGQGVSQEAGFGVRASSTTDPLLLRFARDYPPHEAPPGHEGPPPARLALARLPRGPAVVVHSVALPGREGRQNNFFAHFVVAPGLRPADALAAWGAEGWATDHPADGARQLPRLAQLPRGALINDEAVTAFLQANLPPDSPLVAAGVCPARFVGNPRARRTLLGRFLQGCHLVLQMPPGAIRARFTLVVEPALLALLLYAAARLLPPPLAANLTFSTFERRPEPQWGAQHSLVVGTLLPGPDADLPEGLYQARGVAYNTFTEHCSPELQAREPMAFEWADLAARGEWAVVDEVYRILGKGTVNVTSFKEAQRAARVANRLISGNAQQEDVANLGAASWAGALMAEHHQQLLPLLMEASAHDDRLPQGIAPLLQPHIADLEARLQQALRDEPPGDWLGPWRMLRAAWSNDPVRLREALKRAVGMARSVHGTRLPLLREFHELNLLEGRHRLPPHTLLRQAGPEELTELAESGLPREWYVWALSYGLLTPEGRDEAVRRVLAGEGPLIAQLWDQLARLNNEEQRQAILAPLVQDGSHGALFLGRSLRERVKAPATTLVWMLEQLGAWGERWLEFWAGDDNLQLLLEQLQRGGDDAGPVWSRILAFLGPSLLVDSSAPQARLFSELRRWRDRFALSMPPHAAQRVSNWAVLVDHFETASAVPDEQREQAIQAYQRLSLDPIELLRVYFRWHVAAHEPSPERCDDFLGFFLTFFPTPASSQDHASLFLSWLAVVEACADEGRRATLQAHYLTSAPAPFRQRLVEEGTRTGRLLPQAASLLPAAPVPMPVVAPEAPAPAPAAPPAQPSPAPAPAPAPAPGRVPLLVNAAIALLAFLAASFLQPTPKALAVFAAVVPFALIQAATACMLAQRHWASAREKGKPVQGLALVALVAAGSAFASALVAAIVAVVRGAVESDLLRVAAMSAASVGIGAVAGLVADAAGRQSKDQGAGAGLVALGAACAAAALCCFVLGAGMGG